MKFEDLLQPSVFCARAPRAFPFHESFVGWQGVEYEEIKEDGKRHYLIDGVAYPSITTVLAADAEKKAILDRWKARLGEEKADLVSSSAARRGSSLHLFCELYLTHGEVRIPNHHADKETFLKTRKSLDKYVGRLYCMEKPLVSKKLGIAGRTDLIAEFGPYRTPTVVDFKTSSKTKYHEYIHHYFMQATAYALMFEEMTGVEVPQIAIIIATEEVNEPQLFVEKTETWVQSLENAIQIYRESVKHDQKTRS